MGNWTWSLLVMSLILSKQASLYGQNQPVSAPANPSLPSQPTHFAASPREAQAVSDSDSDADRFRTWRQWNHVLSSTLAQDHEDAGVLVYPNNGFQYTGIYVQHIVYTPDKIKLQLPPKASKTQILYAATTRPPNGSCLEVGTAYVATPNVSVTTPVLYVYNFCAPKGGSFYIPPTAQGGIPIDQKFISTYAQGRVLGLPAYELRIFTIGYPLSAASTWYAELHNNTNDNWDLLYAFTGLAQDLRGWSIFETYYQEGLCSEKLPMLGADQIALFNNATNKWELIRNSVSQYLVTTDTGGTHNNNCFVDDSTGPASYQLLPQPPIFYSWNVRSRQ